VILQRYKNTRARTSENSRYAKFALSRSSRQLSLAPQWFLMGISTCYRRNLDDSRPQTIADSLLRRSPTSKQAALDVSLGLLLPFITEIITEINQGWRFTEQTKKEKRSIMLPFMIR
jgi:hypothetical protein